MTTRGCMLVGYCKTHRPTLKTADFADNVLVGHLVSNQPVTGGQTSFLPVPTIVWGIPGAGSHFGHRQRALCDERYPGAGSDAACPPRVAAGSDAAYPSRAAASPGYHFGGCSRLLTARDPCPATDWHCPQLPASPPQAPCPSLRDSLPHGVILICLCNELGVCNEPGRVISKRRLV